MVRFFRVIELRLGQGIFRKGPHEIYRILRGFPGILLGIALNLSEFSQQRLIFRNHLLVGFILRKPDFLIQPRISCVHAQDLDRGIFIVGAHIHSKDGVKPIVPVELHAGADKFLNAVRPIYPGEKCRNRFSKSSFIPAVLVHTGQV